MRFRYPLQKVVDLKNNEKTQAEWLLSQAIELLRREEASLQELQSMQASLQDRLVAAASDSSSVSELQSLQQYIDHLELLISRKLNDVGAAQGHVVAKREGLTAKMLEEKVWLKAREKAYMAFLDYARKKEQQEIDEIAAVRFGG